MSTRAGTYVPLRVHGSHSLLTGVDPPAGLLARAARLELPALALTDVGSIAGVVEFLRTAEAGLADGGPGRGPSAAGPRPVVGAEIDERGRPGRVVALVREEAGWRSLCKLVSARRLGDDPGDPAAGVSHAAAEPGELERFDLAEAAARFQDGLALLVDHPRLAFALAGRVPRSSLFVAISPASLAKRGSAGVRRARAGERRNAFLDDARRKPSPEELRGRPGEGAASEAEALLDEPKCPPPARAAPAGDLIEAARALGLATLAVPDVWFAHASSFVHHRLRVAIKHNALVQDLPEGALAELPAHLPSPEEMARAYAAVEDGAALAGPLARGTRSHHGMLRRTLEVAESCRYVPALGGVYFPEVLLGEGETAYSRLCELAFAGARERYRPLRPEVVRRLDHELRAIDSLGFSPYFLLVRRIADFARAERIPFVGRGSAADSLVSYCLGLTDADPLRYRLPFERFLNPGRSDRPDIDLDFCWRRRDEVLEHVYRAFGPERTAMISTENRFQLRAAFREAALAAGLPPAEVNRWSRRLPWLVSNAGSEETGVDEPQGSLAHVERVPLPSTHPEEEEPSPARARAGEGPVRGRAGERPARVRASDGPDRVRASEEHSRGVDAVRAREARSANPVARALASTPECRAFPFEDPRWREVLDVAAGLLDTPRHHGLHPGGVVVAPGPITDFVACQRAAKGVVTTQLDKDGVEALGLVKMDLLGNRALTVLDEATRSLRARGLEIDLERLPEDDPRTARLLREGRTLGCSQVESPGMRNLLQQMGAQTMDDVIRAIALIRPGPAAGGMKEAYVRRFRGLDPPTPPHPRLTELLFDGQGVLLYQEDVMLSIALLAGMDAAEADGLRRALEKRRLDEVERLRARFFEGARAEGISEKEARSFWDRIAHFASFVFCKAHAVTYGRIAYRTVWLKAHHPAEYLCAFLNAETGYYETRVYVEEARRLGVRILPPDVNRSGVGFTVEPPAAKAVTEPASGVPLSRSAAVTEPASSVPLSRSTLGHGAASRESETPEAGSVTAFAALRIGLDRVKGLSESTLAALLDSRDRHGPFVSLPDFLARVPTAERDELESLILTGAFDAFDRTRPELLWRLHLLTQPPRKPTAGLDPTLLASCYRLTGAVHAEERVAHPPSRADADACPDPAGARAHAPSPHEGVDRRGAPARTTTPARTTSPAATQGPASTPRPGPTPTPAPGPTASTGGWSRRSIGIANTPIRPGESTLFPAADTPALALPRLPEHDPVTRGRLELDLLGLTVTAHPTTLFPCAGEARLAELRASGHRLRVPPLAPCAALASLRGRPLTLRGWLAASRRVRTETGRWMRFLTLEDDTGTAEVVLFPDVYDRDGHHLTTRGPHLISGTAEDQLGAVTMHAERIW